MEWTLLGNKIFPVLFEKVREWSVRLEKNKHQLEIHCEAKSVLETWMGCDCVCSYRCVLALLKTCLVLKYVFSLCYPVWEKLSLRVKRRDTESPFFVPPVCTPGLQQSRLKDVYIKTQCSRGAHEISVIHRNKFSQERLKPEFSIVGIGGFVTARFFCKSVHLNLAKMLISAKSERGRGRFYQDQQCSFGLWFNLLETVVLKQWAGMNCCIILFVHLNYLHIYPS